MNSAPRVQKDVFRAAALWYATLCSDDVTEAQKEAHRAWLHQDPEHLDAWQQVEKLRQRLHVLPGSTALDTFKIKQRHGHSRRAMLRGSAMLVAGAALGTLAWRQAPVETWMASHKTARGERGEFILADGTRLVLNTATTVDVVYSPSARLIRLYEGEIYIRTGKAAANTPLHVHTGDGVIIPLGTVFTVRKQAQGTHVTVLEDQVDLIPAAAATQLLRVSSGESAYLGANEARLSPTAPQSDAWTRGLLVVTDWPLSQLVAELSRYRSGKLRCAPEVAGLRVSGSFPVDNTDQALQAIANALPVKIDRFTDYWVTLNPRR